MISVPAGKCGPCCSVAASGRTAIHRSHPAPTRSGQWMSVQSRGTLEVIDQAFSMADLPDSFVLVTRGPLETNVSGHSCFLSCAKTTYGVQHEPGSSAASVNGPYCGLCHGI